MAFLILQQITDALPGMTPINRKIASYILEHGQSIGFSSIYAMGKTIGVSNATLIRFARSIGLKGYADLKHALQDEIKHKLSPYEKIALSDLDSLPHETQLHKMLQNEVNNLRKTLDRQSLEALERIVSGICGADRVYISGFGVSRHLAGLFGDSLLGTLDKKVSVISGSVSDYVPTLKALGPKDIVVLLTFPPYSGEVLHVASVARERGCKFFLFTDSVRCPVYPFADTVVTCENNSLLLSNSFVGLVAIMQLVLNMVCLHDKKAAMKNRHSMMELETQGYEMIGRLEHET